MSISIVRFFIPGPPVGKGRPRFARMGTKVRTFTPRATEQYERAVATIARLAMLGGQPLPGAMAVSIEARHVPPPSWTRKRRAAALDGEEPCTQLPDLDNVAKIICDACNGVVWADDRAVTMLVLSRVWVESQPGVLVHVERPARVRT